MTPFRAVFLIALLTAAGWPASNSNISRGRAQIGLEEINIRVPSPLFPNLVAKGDGVTDDTAAIQAACDYGSSLGRPYQIYAPAGTYKVTAQINCVADTATADQYLNFPSIRGAGSYVTTFQVAGSVGGGKTLFNFGSNSLQQRVIGYPVISGITIAGTSSSTDPMGVYMPYTNMGSVYDVTCRQLRNTCIFNRAANNGDFNLVRSMAGGYQPMYKQIPTGTTFAMTSGSAAIVASAPTFNCAADVGKEFYVEKAATAVPPGDTLSSRIVACANSTHATLADQATNTIVAENGSWGLIRGSISAGSNVLTITSPTSENVYTANDLSRFVYITDAGDDGNLLIAKVSEILSPSSVRLDTAATGAVSNVRVYMGPAFVWANASNEVGRKTNDFRVNDLRVEQFNGPAIVANNAVSLYINGKMEGLSASTGNNFAVSAPNLIADGIGQIDYSGDSNYSYNNGSAPFIVSGSTSRLMLHDFQVWNLSSNESLVDLQQTSGQVVVANGYINSLRPNLVSVTPLVRRGVGVDANRIIVSGIITRIFTDANQNGRLTIGGISTDGPQLKVDGDDIGLVQFGGHNSTVGQTISTLRFTGRNSASEDVNYGSFQTFISDATDGSEDGTVSGNAMVNGTLTKQFAFKDGLYVGSGATNTHGSGTVTADTKYYVGGNAGLTSAAVIGGCTLTITGGIITAKSGC